MKTHLLFFAVAGLVLFAAPGCSTNLQDGSATPTPVTHEPPLEEKVYETIGTVVRLLPDFDQLVPTNAVIEKLASGFEWAEGPVWIPRANHLLFSDVPKNVVYQWAPGSGVSVFLENSGYSGSTPRAGSNGSNGLTLDANGRLVLAQHGDRQIGRLEKDGKIKKLAEFYQWRRFNSPNDLVYRSNGDLYFTDPPYGLPRGKNDPNKELSFSGVYRLSTDGTVTLLTAALTFPNGIAFSPDEKTLYVAVSDPQRAVLMAYDVLPDGMIGNGRVFFDATPLTSRGKGLPDGLKVDQKGNVFTTGPGGVLVLSPDGKHLGTLSPGEATANCAWGDDGSVLYMTADMYLCRIQTSTLGTGFKARK